MFLPSGAPYLYEWCSRLPEAGHDRGAARVMGRGRKTARAGATGRSRQPEQLLDLDRYVPALITNTANKLSRTATVLYQKRFGVNVTEWRILAQLALEPGTSAARICQVIGYDKGPISR